VKSFLFLGSPANIPAPVEYARFTQRRAMWKELGTTPETATHEEWQQGTTFLQLEAKYAKQNAQKPQ